MTWDTFRTLRGTKSIYLDHVGTLRHSKSYGWGGKVPIFLTFWRNQVLHSYFSFLTWQLRNIEVAEVCGRPQNFVVNGFVKPSYCLLKRVHQSLFLVCFHYLIPWASLKVRKPYLNIKSKKMWVCLLQLFHIWHQSATFGDWLQRLIKD